MKRFLQVCIMAVVLAAPGCCSTRDTESGVSTDDYKAAIEQIKSNLSNNIKPTVSDLMAESARPDEWKTAKLELIDDTITLCEDVLAGKNAGKKPEADK